MTKEDRLSVINNLYILHDLNCECGDTTESCDVVKYLDKLAEDADEFVNAMAT